MDRNTSRLDEATYSTRRLEALTDGVFAIAMTLLVLDLNVKDIGNAASSGQLWHGLYELGSPIASFVVSFLVLGSMWAVHARQFEYIKRADRHLTAINTCRLLAVVFLPLTTSIAGAYSGLILGNILLPLNFLIITLISYWEWRYAVRSKNKLYDESLTKKDMEYFEIRNQTIVITAVGVVVLSAFIGEPAFALFLLAPSFGKVWYRLRAKA